MSPKFRPDNDRNSPIPGFTGPQLVRLAVVYVAASVRQGTWLIPAFHASIDEGIKGGHDDPQRFNLSEWSCKLHETLVSLNRRTGPCP
jgi:hypothetical protein